MELSHKKKLFRISTVPISLNILLKGQLRYLNQYYDITGISSPGEDLDAVAEREGIRTRSICIERKISPLKDLRALYLLYKYFKKEQPYIVHSITPKAGLLSMLAAKFAGIPIRMHTFTGLIFPSKNGILQSILILMDRLLCRCATNIYPEGLGVKKDLIQYKITSKPLKVIANGNINGIDTSFFNPLLFSSSQQQSLKKELNINENDFVFIFVGRLVSDKGINELIKAFDNINQKYTEVKLLLVGPLESNLDPLKEETLDVINKNKHIISIGWQSDVRPYFAISDALVFPSYREGFPNVVMQAGAMGLPAIVTNINGCNEIIEEGNNGTIIPSKNAMVLEDKMIKFVVDKNYLQQLRLNAREMIISRYEQKKVWEALLEEYKALEKRYKKDV
ncbi:glycosyltransferase family 4 protein [Dysgonomonas sp. 511]|uniref:glycosyltransferase family 4 protein n=1 Tax=Dysgonomonas sp. 511 TaxID=2302930 RepID=UPI0013D52E8C|nr:glycosyltransferase family 4 protein [Dysgonomonas sp. 511]NDV78852.1 glycosyltransferase family 1 protein [Dysgonomonas sp. 511]